MARIRVCQSKIRLSSGLQLQEFGATYDAFLASVHLEDRQMVKVAVVVSRMQRRLVSKTSTGLT